MLITFSFYSKSLFTKESWDDIEEVGKGGAGYDPTAKMEKMGHARQINYSIVFRTFESEL